MTPPTQRQRLESRLQSALFYKRYWGTNAGPLAVREHEKYARITRNLQRQIAALDAAEREAAA